MTGPGQRVTRFALERPRVVAWAMGASTLVLALLAAVPTVWAPARAWLHPAEVDTDPENMLAADEPVRIHHRELKKAFQLSDMVVVGVVNEQHPEGVFNPATLARVYELTEFAKTLRGERIGAEPGEGVVEPDLLAPSTVDDMQQAGLGAVRFSWLMERPPRTDAEAIAVRDRAQRIPFLSGTLVSEDGKALALYIPLTEKHLAHRISQALQEKIAELGGAEAGDAFHITGLPVAEDTFGVEMFKQMAISAPIAMAVIFALLWFFFRSMALIVPPMIVAMVSAISTMALLVVTGNTIHIMSSMIPIFIMPIAVLDAIHIVSDFFDRHGSGQNRRETMAAVMGSLFTPMLFTSLTTGAGFASLALTPIPPVQVFGIFVGIGVMLAWLWTILFIPAAVMLVPERALASVASSRALAEAAAEEAAHHSPLARALQLTGRFAFARPRLVLAGVLVLCSVAAYGMSQIRINDNPTKWFTPSHPIRVADRVLNEHFGGTYMAYLDLTAPPPERSLEARAEALGLRLGERRSSAEAEGWPALSSALALTQAQLTTLVRTAGSEDALHEGLEAFVSSRSEEADDDGYAAWEEVQALLDGERTRDQVLKQPRVLAWIKRLQEHLGQVRSEDGRLLVGKSNSIVQVLESVHRELMLGDDSQLRIPDTPQAVAQCLITYEGSHRPHDLDHLVARDERDPDTHFRRASVWVQLKSGDNRDMVRVADAATAFVASQPPPVPIEAQWFGLTYLNVVWQDKMVSGMLRAFLGSFAVVLVMMIALFRSPLFGLLSMIPLTVTVALIYGLIGLIGKDYDMPVAVLSSLSLGLAVDYAIHFLARSRAAVHAHGSWEAAVAPVFGEPARAIARNAVVVGVGFLPLLLAPLVPYQTVGVFIATILLTAGVATLVILPALVTLLRCWLFGPGEPATAQPVAAPAGTSAPAPAAPVPVASGEPAPFALTEKGE